MSEHAIGTPEPDDESVEGRGTGEEFYGELGEREEGDAGFEGEFGEREHEGVHNVSREADAEEPPFSP